jgi:predicted DsbA family dithiol-disulfide isomerase
VCYIGQAEVDRLREEFPIELEEWGFELHPETPLQGVPHPDASGRLQHLLQVAKEAGLPMGTPPFMANSRKAHEATEFARDKGKLEEFRRAVFHAFWVDGENIGEPDVLCRLAEGCGLDAGELAQALADGRYWPRLEEQIKWSLSMGFTGVPVFLFNDKYAAVGLYDHKVLQKVAERLLDGDLPAEAQG